VCIFKQIEYDLLGTNSGGKILKTKKVLHTCLYTVKNKNIVCDVFPELEGGGGGGGVGRRGGLPLMCTSLEL
jgi:hypothetical protein